MGQAASPALKAAPPLALSLPSSPVIPMLPHSSAPTAVATGLDDVQRPGQPDSILLAVVVQAAKTIPMETPGVVYFVPLNLSACEFPKGLPLLAYPHRDLLARGALASPFLLDSADFSSLALACIPNSPVTVKEGSNVATIVPVCLELGPSMYDSLGDPIFCPIEMFLTQAISHEKPLLSFSVEGLPFTGLVDSGADVSVIREAEWPAEWPTVTCPAVRGVGGVQESRVSTRWLPVTHPQSSVQARIRPVVLALHINLWGRDLLSQFRASLSLQ